MRKGRLLVMLAVTLPHCALAHAGHGENTILIGGFATGLLVGALIAAWLWLVRGPDNRL